VNTIYIGVVLVKYSFVFLNEISELKITPGNVHLAFASLLSFIFGKVVKKFVNFSFLKIL
jgi:hypothetical protein